MDFNLTKEQEQLADTVQRFVKGRYSFEARRTIIKSEAGFSREIWASLAELGLLGLLVPEEHGGIGAGALETMLTLTAFGRGLLVEPFIQSAILATVLIRELGSAAQKEEHLPRLAAGDLIAVPAHGERGARYDLSSVATTAARDGDGYTLSGDKAVVLHAPSADLLLVSARTSGPRESREGISLFLVPRDAQGLSLKPYPTIDGMRAAEVRLEQVKLPASALLGKEGAAFPALSAAFDIALAALCAEAVGALQESLDATIEYTKTRKQFGVPIGKFQALQHRMADMLMHVEQARSMSFLAAVRCTDPDAAVRAKTLSAAKVVIGQACRYVGQQSIQLHGGMGMTDELMISHHFRRLTAIELSLGDTEHHLEQFMRSEAP